MSKDDPATNNLTAEQIADAKYRAWRTDVGLLLDQAQRFKQSTAWGLCGSLMGNFDVLVCDGDVTHEARALPYTCKLRICPDCERRRSAELVSQYTPILKDLAEKDERAGWSLKKITFGTRFSLEAENAQSEYAEGWACAEKFLQALMQWHLQREMTPDEIRRGRVDYSPHGVGFVISAEYGEEGRHLHFHLTGYLPWIDKRKSSDFLREATGGDAYVTYVQGIKYHEVEDAVREQIKYITKFQDLPAALAVKLLKVLDGKKRFRTYGLVRDAEKPEPDVHVCNICGNPVRIVYVRRYFERCIDRNVQPAPDILAAAADFYLDLKRGNKVGEASDKKARDDPDDLPTASELPGFDAVFTPKKPFRYD